MMCELHASYGRLISDPAYADPDFVDCPADQIETVLRELGKDVSDFELLGDVPTKYIKRGDARESLWCQ